MTSLLIGMGAPLYETDDGLWIERQTASGLHGWNIGFDRITAFAPCLSGPPPEGYVDASQPGVLPAGTELMPLPFGYDRGTYLRTRSDVRRRLSVAMAAAEANVFSFGGWYGDWGMEAANVAAEENVPHAVWLDRIESQVVSHAPDASAISRFKASVKGRLVARNERTALRRADLALLHGRTVYDGLKDLSRNPWQSEDIHLGPDDRIPSEALRTKVGGVAQEPLRIVYAGRATTMKGPFDWIEVIARATSAGVPIRADWLGDGPDLEAMKARAAEAGLSDVVTFHGFVEDAAEVRDILRAGHLLLFTHLTDESPRILIEALFAGLPLVGYSDLFAHDIVAEKGAGLLVPRGDKAALVKALHGFDADRDRLAALIERAGASGTKLTHGEVFAERCRIVKRELLGIGSDGSGPHIDH